jgi:hypothetical protein
MNNKALIAFSVLGLLIATGASAEVMSTKATSGKTKIMALQEGLNACGADLSVDGRWGRMTTTAIKSFQEENDLKVDGKVGPITAAAINDCEAEEEDETATSDETTPTGTSTSTALKGGAGDIKNVRELSSYAGETVYEGQTKTVYEMEVEADTGSDIGLTSTRIAVKNFRGVLNANDGSAVAKRYFSVAKVMLDGKEVGSVMGSEMTESSNIYSANVPLSGAVVKAGMKSRLTISVMANEGIDTTDAGNDKWGIAVTSIRFTDATGAILTNTPIAFTAATVVGNVKTFDFARISTSSIMKARVSLDGTNPTAKVVKVDQSNITQDVTLLKFTIKAEGSDLTLNSIPVNITVAGTNATTVGVLSNLKLSDGKTTLDSLSPSAVTSTGWTVTSGVAGTAVFGGSSNMKYVIAKDTTKTFTVMANVKACTHTSCGGTIATAPGIYESGATVKAELAPANVTASDIRDSQENNLGTSATNRIGSASGDAMTLRTQGVSATQVSVSTPTNLRGNSSAGTNITESSVTFRLNVTATGAEFFIPKTVEYVAGAGSAVVPTAAAAKGFTVALLNGANYPATSEVPLANVSGSVTYISGARVDSNGLIAIADGQTAVVDVTVTLTDTVGTAAVASTPAGQYVFGITSINAATATSLTPTLTGAATQPYASFQSSTTGSFL